MRDVILLSLSSELDVVVVVVAAVAVAADGDATTCVNSHGSTKLPPPLPATTSAPRPSSGEFIATNHSFAAPWQIASLACPRGQQHGSPAMCRPAGVCPRARANTWQHKAASVEDSPARPPSVGQVQARKSRNRMNLISILSLPSAQLARSFVAPTCADLDVCQRITKTTPILRVQEDKEINIGPLIGPLLAGRAA